MGNWKWETGNAARPVRLPPALAPSRRLARKGNSAFYAALAGHGRSAVEIATSASRSRRPLQTQRRFRRHNHGGITTRAFLPTKQVNVVRHICPKFAAWSRAGTSADKVRQMAYFPNGRVRAYDVPGDDGRVPYTRPPPLLFLLRLTKCGPTGPVEALPERWRQRPLHCPSHRARTEPRC